MSVSEAEPYLSTVLRLLLAEHSSPADRHRMSRYDSLIVAAALEGHCERLYSQDFPHGRFKMCGLRIVCLLVEIQHLSSSC